MRMPGGDDGHRLGCSFDEQVANLGGEVVAAFGVVRVRVERRTRGRQQHRVAGLRELAPRPARRRASIPRSRPVETSRNAAATSGPASPNATTPRTRSPARASTPRSRPLLRPPASNTTESNDSSARRVASGFVAFESSYQRTPPASPTSATRWGRVAYDASAARTPAVVAPTASAASRRGQRVRAIVNQRAAHAGDRRQSRCRRPRAS